MSGTIIRSAAVSSTTIAHARLAACRKRVSSSPRVFIAIHSAPCIVSATTDPQRDREPIQDAGVGSYREICREIKKKGIVRVERNPTQNVTQCSAEKKRKEHACSRKDHVPERHPNGTYDVTPKFYSDAP